MRTMARNTVSYSLAAAIESRGLSAYAVGRMADVDPGVVSRFLTGRRDLKLATVDRLAAALGLRLESVRAPRKGRPAAAPAAAPDPGPVAAAPDPDPGPDPDPADAGLAGPALTSEGNP